MSINTDKGDRIKAGITRKLNESNLVLCIVEEETYLDLQCNGNLKKQKSLGKRL